MLAQEEERFAETLATGMALLDAETAKLAGKVIPGETVFKLYDTYGFPLDLTADVARERGLSIDQAGFDAAMEAQRGRARAASKFGADPAAGIKLEVNTGFRGLRKRLADSGRVVALISDGALVDVLAPGQEGQVVLDHTPFYAESGGQVGDTGVLSGGGGALHRPRHPEDRRRARACRRGRSGRTARRRPARGAGRCGEAPRTRAQSLRDPFAARGPARSARQARAAEGLAGRARTAALRFLALASRDAADELRRIEQRVNRGDSRENAAAETRVMRFR